MASYAEIPVANIVKSLAYARNKIIWQLSEDIIQKEIEQNRPK